MNGLSLVVQVPKTLPDTTVAALKAIDSEKRTQQRARMVDPRSGWKKWDDFIYVVVRRQLAEVSCFRMLKSAPDSSLELQRTQWWNEERNPNAPSASTIHVVSSLATDLKHL